MARAEITYQLAEDEVLSAEIDVEDSYPDAVDEARTQAQRMFLAALADVMGNTRPAAE